MATNPLTSKLSVLFNCAENDDAVLAAATKANGAMSVVDAMLKSYGATDFKDLVAKATEAQKAASQAVEVGTKMSELLATLDGSAQEEQKKETEQIAASLGYGTDARGVSGRSVIMSEGLAARRAALGIIVGPAGADGKPTLTLGAKDPAKLDAYRTNYPMPNAEQQRNALLTTPLVAGASGLQLGGTHTAAPAGGGASQPGTRQVPEHIAALASYPGVNDVERALALLNDKQAGFSKLDWHRQCFLAGRYLETGKAA